jgi:protein-arginine kinase activator protein McsA
MEYICEYCNFNTKKKYNYDKHIESNKHKILESKLVVTPKSTQSQHLVIPESTQNQQKVAAPFTCKYCEQNFKFKQSMYRHIKYTCTKNKTEDLTELVRLLNARLEKQDKQLETQAKQIDKLMGKLEINGSFNNTVNITNNISLLNYKDTDISHLTDEDYKKCFLKIIENKDLDIFYIKNNS